MISKELLSEVLGEEVRIVVHWTDKIVQWNEHRNLPHTLEEINIYELAHKCKEWAFSKNIILNVVYSKKFSNVFPQNYITEEKFDMFTADTEPEAIFKACEWIKDNK